MNFSCLFFNDDGEVCFAEVLVAPSLSEAIALAQGIIQRESSYAWFEIWLDGERMASSHDGGAKPTGRAKSRDVLH